MNKFTKLLPALLGVLTLVAPIVGPSVQGFITSLLAAHPLAASSIAGLGVIVANFWPQPHKP